MKRAVITTGNKQYIVAEGDEVQVEKLSDTKKQALEALMVIDGEKITVGKPVVDGVKVNIEVLEPVLLADKVTSIRYKSKKRVKKVRGHRQQLTRIKITKIN